MFVLCDVVYTEIPKHVSEELRNVSGVLGRQFSCRAMGTDGMAGNLDSDLDLDLDLRDLIERGCHVYIVSPSFILSFSL